MSVHFHATTGASFLQAAIMWQVMMAGMMMPATLPWLRAASALSDARSASARLARTLVFLGGYLAVWTAYSLVAALAQVTLSGAALLGHHGTLGRPLGGTLLIAAGLFQFSPLKRACLEHCRNPLTYFLTRWQSGAPGLFRMGVSHGSYCVACCWALMATAFALGVMNLAWMAVLAGATVAEQVLPRGTAIAAAVGVGLLACGLVTLLS